MELNGLGTPILPIVSKLGDGHFRGNGVSDVRLRISHFSNPDLEPVDPAELAVPEGVSSKAYEEFLGQYTALHNASLIPESDPEPLGGNSPAGGSEPSDPPPTEGAPTSGVTEPLDGDPEDAELGGKAKGVISKLESGHFNGKGVSDIRLRISHFFNPDLEPVDPAELAAPEGGSSKAYDEFLAQYTDLYNANVIPEPDPIVEPLSVEAPLVPDEPPLEDPPAPDPLVDPPAPEGDSDPGGVDFSV